MKTKQILVGAFACSLTASVAAQEMTQNQIEPPLWGKAPVETAITMPATAPYYAALAHPARLEGDITLIWFKTTRETIASLANGQKPGPNPPQPKAKVLPSFRPTASTAEEPCQMTVP